MKKCLGLTKPELHVHIYYLCLNQQNVRSQKQRNAVQSQNENSVTQHETVKTFQKKKKKHQNQHNDFTTDQRCIFMQFDVKCTASVDYD